MGRVKLFGAALVLLAALASADGVLSEGGTPAVPGAAAASDRELFAQSAARILDREFAGDEISYLLFDAASGALLTARWPAAEKAIPLGSLVKPFTALAYAQHHAYRYPVYACHGSATGCWRLQPHGSLNIVSALAVSCNSYFRDLAGRVTGEQMQELASGFGLDPPDPGLSGTALMGIGEQWPISPLHMAGAYLELVRRRSDPGVQQILEGLADSAQWGTGSAVGRALKHADALVKTGTASCRHEHPAPGDGFVVAVVPADHPAFLLMVRVHGVPGATAAATAGRMLSRLEE
jgi:cell division protein FtsI/penicillin-binding protein 2